MTIGKDMMRTAGKLQGTGGRLARGAVGMEAIYGVWPSTLTLSWPIMLGRSRTPSCRRALWAWDAAVVSTSWSVSAATDMRSGPQSAKDSSTPSSSLLTDGASTSRTRRDCAPVLACVIYADLSRTLCRQLLPATGSDAVSPISAARMNGRIGRLTVGLRDCGGAREPPSI